MDTTPTRWLPEGLTPDGNGWTLTDLTVEGTTLADLHTVALWEGTVSKPYPSTLIGTPA